MDKREFALQLIVGVRDLFSQKVNRIEALSEKLQKRLQSLDGKVKNIEAFGKLSREISQLSAAEKVQVEKIKALESTYERLNQELKETESQYKSEGKNSRKLESKLKTLRTEIKKVSSSLKEEKEKLHFIRSEKEKTIKKTEALKRALQNQGVTLNDVSKDLEKYQKELEETAKKQEELEKKLSSSSLMTVSVRLKRLAALGGIGASATFALKDIVEQVKEFDRQSHLIVARTELTAKDLDRVKKDLIDIYRITGKAPEEIAEVYTQIRQLTGLQGEELKKATIQALKVQKVIPEWDTKEITRAVAQMRKAFGITAEEATDLMTTVFTKAGDKANDLLDTLWEYAPLMREAGLSAKEFAAYLIAGAQEGAFNFDKLADTVKESFKARLTDMDIWHTLVGQGEKAGIIDQLLPAEKFGHEARKIKQYLAEIREGFETGDDKKKKEGYSKLLQHLAVLYKRDAQAARNIMEQIFGVQGTEDITHKVLARMGEAIADPDRILGKWKGATDQMFQESKTFFDRLNDAWRRVETVFLKSFDDLARDLKPVGDVILQIANAIGSFAEKHPLLTKITLAILGVVAVLGTLGAVIQFVAMAVSFAVGGLALLASPFTLIIAVAGAVVAAILYFKERWNEVWNAVKSKFSSVVNFVKSGFQALASLFARGLKFFIDYSPVGLFLKAVKSVVEFITGIDLTKAGKKIIETLTAGILSVLKKPLEAVNWLKSKIFGAFGFIFGGDEKEEEKKRKLKEKGLTPPTEVQRVVEKTAEVPTRVQTERSFEKERFERLSERLTVVKEQGTKVLKQVSFSPKVNVSLEVTLQGVSEQNFKEKLLEAINRATPEVKWAFEKLMKEIWEENLRYSE